MLYKEIIGLNDYFEPAYDITNENSNYWKTFIITDDFKNILNDFLNSLSANTPNEKKSLWIHGTYGIGKSHATGVIKHLLFDPIEEIKDFADRFDSQLKQKLLKFREENKVFPFTLKGISGIHNKKTFVLTIEKTIKNTLIKNNIYVKVKSDFEKYIDILKKENTEINWENIINNNYQLKQKAKNKEELIKKLENYDVETLNLLEDSFEDIAIPLSKIEDWLEEVVNELREKNICSAITIYWDEFTSVLESSESNSYLNILQNIAEKTKDTNIFIFIISHIAPEQSKYYDSQNYKKVLDRFHEINYKMQDITTFHILNEAIKKKDKDRWLQLKENIYKDNEFVSIIWKINENESTENKKLLTDLFPFHPYTAYISTKLAERIGSTERSIFKFLFDEEKGFLRFIEEYPQKNGELVEYFLTADKLWDFFYDELLTKQDQKFYSILEKFGFNSDLKNRGAHYSAIFKSILLLNLIYFDFSRQSSDSNTAYQPKEENIKAMFKGTSFENKIDEVLKYIDDNIIQKTPDGFFLVSSSSLPINEINEEKEKIKDKYKDIIKAFYENKKEDLANYLKLNILRECEVNIYSANLSSNDIIRNITNDFKKNYTINIVLFLPTYENEIKKLENELENLKSDNYFKTIIEEKNIIFIISKNFLGEKEFNNLLLYEANMVVAEKHNYKERKELDLKYKNIIIDNWISNITNDETILIFKSIRQNVSFLFISDYISRNIISTIFKYGPDKIQGINRNLWNYQIPSKTIEIFLFNNLRNQLEEKLSSGVNKPLLNLLKDNKDFIVDNNLKIKENIDPENLILKITQELNREIKKKEGQEFNLAELTKFLQYPPFGLYPNNICGAILGFAFRDWIDKLYEIRTGVKITKEVLRDKIALIFKAWESNKTEEKLNVRLGCEEEQKLIELLNELFNLNCFNDGLNSIIWKIGDKLKQKGLPLWSIKYLNNDKDFKTAIDSICYLLIAVDKEIDQEKIQQIYNLLNNYKLELKNYLNDTNLRKGFFNFLNNIENIQVNDNEIDNVLQFLNQNMQEEIRLWEENKVESKVKDWQLVKNKSKVEQDFIKLMQEIFNIEGSNTLNELKNKIRKKINQDLKLPVRFLSYIFDKDDILNSIKEIDKFININNDPHNEELKEYYNKIVVNSKIISNNLNKEILKEGFKTFIKQRYNFFEEEFYQFIICTAENELFNIKEELFDEYIIQYKFFKSLQKLFQINNIKKLEEFLKDIEKAVIYKFEYPIWIYTLYNNNDKATICNTIINLIEANTYLDKAILIEFYSIINKNNYNYINFFDNNEMRSIFIKWMQNDLKLKYADDEIIKNIRINLQGKEFYFDKDKVENWLMKNGKDIIPVYIKTKVKEKISYCNKDFKSILLKAIDEHPEIINWIEDYL